MVPPLPILQVFCNVTDSFSNRIFFLKIVFASLLLLKNRTKLISLCLHPHNLHHCFKSGFANLGISVQPGIRAVFTCLQAGWVVAHPSRQTSNGTSSRKADLLTHYYPAQKN